MIDDFCGESYQCKYDYATSLSREFAQYSKYYQDQFINIYEGVLRPDKIVRFLFITGVIKMCLKTDSDTRIVEVL